MSHLAADTRSSFVLHLPGTDPVLCTTYQELPPDTSETEIRRRKAVGSLVKPTTLAVCGPRRTGQLVYLLEHGAVEAWPFWGEAGDPGQPIGRLEHVRFETLADERSDRRRSDEETDEQVIVSSEVLDRMAWRLVVDETDGIVMLGRAIFEKKLPIATWDLPDERPVAAAWLTEKLSDLDPEIAKAASRLAPPVN
jgi:hypothetical protein